MTGPLVVRSAERPAESRPGGQPLLQRLVGADTGARSLTVLRNDCGAGEAVVEHIHDVEEVLLVVSGAAEVSAGGGTARLEPGDAVVVPAGQTHSFLALRDATQVIGVLAAADAATRYSG